MPRSPYHLVAEDSDYGERVEHINQLLGTLTSTDQDRLLDILRRVVEIKALP